MTKKMPTLDGQESWVMDVNEFALEMAQKRLEELRGDLNRLDYDRGEKQKTFVTGLTCGIEAYLNNLSKGEKHEESA